MAIRKYRPVTPGTRGMSTLDRSELSKERPLKSLVQPKPKNGGRNFQGFITADHRGGGHKRKYREIDFRRDKDNMPAQVEGVEYDPNRSCFIARIRYADGQRRYILAPLGLKPGQSVMSGERTEPNPGCTMPLANIPLGLQVHNIEMQPGGGGKLVRSAGGMATLMAREGEMAIMGLPSGEQRKVHVRCRATIGQLGNVEHSSISLGKAGRKRHMGRRPHTRGVAQNPVSHPMGGGEGRRKGGRHPCSRTGLLSKGGKTRRRRKGSSKFIIRRRTPGRFQTGK